MPIVEEVDEDRVAVGPIDFEAIVALLEARVCEVGSRQAGTEGVDQPGEIGALEPEVLDEV